jgi:plasmid stabilization system protein ParE
MKVIWTRKAKSRIKDIFYFYSKKVSTALANRIIAGIAQKPSRLLKHPELGQREKSLEDIHPELRFLIEGNYKLIYLRETEHLVIVSVFDTRQNPIKLREIK